MDIRNLRCAFVLVLALIALPAVVRAESSPTDSAAFTIGHYSFGPDNYRATWKDHLFVHEYGHYIQSQILGGAYLTIVAVPSLISAAGLSDKAGTDHSHRWFEVSASKLGAKHFDKKYGSGASGYTERNENYFDKQSFWKEKTFSPYINPRIGDGNEEKHPISGTDILFWDYLIFI